MTGSEPVTQRADGGLSFIDLVHGMLLSPSQTVETLCDETHFRASRDSALHAARVVMLASAISGVIQCNAPFPAIILIALGCVIGGLLNWLLLAWILQLVCRWLSKSRTFTSCLTLIGWTSLPLIFTAPLECFKNLSGPLYLLLAVLPGVWSFCLLFLVFQHATAMSKMKTFLLIVVGPPLFALSYMFWCLVAAISAVQLVTS